MKTKLARVFYWMADKFTALADWLSGVKTVTFKPMGATLATAYVSADSQIAPAAGTIVTVDGMEFHCMGTKPSASGLGFEMNLEKMEPVDVFAGEQFETKPEEKGEE